MPNHSHRIHPQCHPRVLEQKVLDNMIVDVFPSTSLGNLRSFAFDSSETAIFNVKALKIDGKFLCMVFERKFRVTRYSYTKSHRERLSKWSKNKFCMEKKTSGNSNF